MKGKHNEVRQWIASLAGSICFATVGSAYYWVTPLLVNFNSPNSPVPMTATDSSWISATVAVSDAMFCLPAGHLADKFGRRNLLISAGPIILVAWALIIMTRSLLCLYIARFIQGFSGAIVLTAAPAYVAEIAEPKIRGKLSGLLQCGWLTGCLYVYITGAYLNYNFNAFACASLAIIIIILLLVVPESPYYLLMQKKEQKALEALKWLQHSQNMNEELQAIKEAVDKDMERKRDWKDLFATKKEVKAFFLVQFVGVLKVFNGCTALKIYVTETFHENLDLGFWSNELTIIFGIVLVLATLLSSLLTDKIGRRLLIIVSSLGGVILNIIVAVIFFLDEKTTVDVTHYKWITFVCIVGIVVIGSVGTGSLLNTLQAEYFPSHTRSIGGGIAQSVVGLAAGISVIQYAMFIDCFGTYMNFVLFGIVSFIGVIISIILIPETTGKSLSEVQECFDQ